MTPAIAKRNSWLVAKCFLSRLRHPANGIQDEYSKSIDTSTLLAIISDYNICDAAQLSAARQVLDILRATVPDDEASGFDPSGASGGPGTPIDAPEEDSPENESRSGSGKSHPAWRSQTDDTSLSQEIALLDLEDTESFMGDAEARNDNISGFSYTTEFDALDEVGKESALMGIFPILKPFDIKWALKKYKGEVSLAIDELMTQSFLEENGNRHKGIDAFTEGDVLSRPRKGKSKKKRKQIAGGGTTGSNDESSPVESKWEKGRQDIEFVASRTEMQAQQVSSIYHASGGSMRKAIAAIIQAHKSMALANDDDPILQLNAFELREEFPSLSLSDSEALVQLAPSSLSNARDLAKALTAQSQVPVTLIQPEFRHTPLNLSGASILDKPTPLSNKTLLHSLENASAATIAKTYTEARNSAFTQASSYYRKGKSNHLMGGAAAYYAQEGRDFNVLAKRATSAAADAHVAAQSSRTELDLHGVNVKDALRISKEQVTGWWHELGESRIGNGGGVGAGYRIVTGKGAHSAGGKSRLGPAVGKMLIRDGWKVEVLPGAIIVKGVVTGDKRRS
ncbi:hypothetical protein G7Y89_g9647 [Cudoniella acicularis]|uniref:Smr domain-containing protein n=1 Tax=Cudoniella acicularis TaxID=354080 RepID=A0A8H4RGX4_9HELO|nr:hypothetical protein G7Y89_g9647 [Cudoniella acicularis]